MRGLFCAAGAVLFALGGILAAYSVWMMCSGTSSDGPFYLCVCAVLFVGGALLCQKRTLAKAGRVCALLVGAVVVLSGLGLAFASVMPLVDGTAGGRGAQCWLGVCASLLLVAGGVLLCKKQRGHSAAKEK